MATSVISVYLMFEKYGVSVPIFAHPYGMHGAVRARLGDEADPVPAEESPALVGYVADIWIKAYLENLAVDHVLPEMPMSLDPDYYINVPMEATYQTAWHGTPAHCAGR